MMRIYILTLFCNVFIFIGLSQSSNGQTCSPLSIHFPDTICLGQSVKGINTGPQNLNYTWDPGAGDLSRTPTATAIPLAGISGSLSGVAVHKIGNKYIGFVILSTSSSLARLDFDTSLLSTPTVTNLGNIGNSMVSPSGFKMIKVGNSFFGFTINRSTGTVIRFNFGSDLMSVPTSTSITMTGMGTILSFEIIEEAGKYYVMIPSYTTTKMGVLNFNTDISGTPVFSTYTLPIGNYGGITSLENCQGKFIMLTDASASGFKALRLKYATSFAATNPITSTIDLSSIGQKPGPIVFTNDGGRLFAIIGGFTFASGISLLNFGESIENNPVVSVAIAGSPLSVLGLSNQFRMSNGVTCGLYSTDGGVLGRLTFPNINLSYSGTLTGFQPPVFNFPTPGKFFIGYTGTDLSGNSYSGGASIYVRNTPGLGQSEMDFTADEQCLGRPTKFYPNVSPTGSYSYKWTFPGGITSTQAIASRQFPSIGSYPVTLRVKAADGCNTGSITKQVKIFNTPTNSPTSAFTVPTQVCTKDSIQFVDQSTPVSAIKRWRWEFGTGNVSFSKNPKTYFQTNQAGQTIQVSLTASDSSGCGVPVTHVVTPQAGSDILFTTSKECKGEILQFQNNTTPIANVNFLWNFGEPSSGGNNSSTSSLPIVTHQFADTGLYQVNLRAITQNGCSTNVTKPVRIYPLPLADFTVPDLSFPNVSLPFTNKSKGKYQNITSSKWKFGDPASGVLDSSNLENPYHMYSASGLYSAVLKVNTDKNCKGEITKPVSIYANCPQIIYSKTASSSGNYDTLFFNNQTNLVKETRIDYCAGDLGKNPVLQSQQSGSPAAIVNASQFISVKDGNQWYGFMPCPFANNATSFYKATFGNSINNDISAFSSAISNPQNLFSAPSFIRFFKEDSIWFGIAANANKLYRLNFGTSLNNSSPVPTEITLPTGTLATPTNAQIVKDRDTTYIFVTNNNNNIVNNLIRLRFTNSLLDTPSVLVYSNPPVLQGSNGFFGISFTRECDNWYGLLIGNGQLYKLNYGFSLNNIPTVSSLNDEVTPFLPSTNAFINLRGITILNDIGKAYALINTSAGALFRVRFGSGISQMADDATSLGSLGITGTVGTFSFVQDGSEFFALGINTLGTVYKIKFPNRCSASKPYSVQTTPGNDTIYYQEPGKYYITITSESPFGTVSQKLDSVTIEDQSLSLSCRTTTINHPNEICYDYKLNASVNTTGLQNVTWDFCTGDFRLPPTRLVNPIATSIGSTGGVQTVIEGGLYYTFIAGATGLARYNIGASPELFPGSPIPITLPSSANFTTLNDIKIFKEGANWFGICTYLNGESIVRLNFGTDITKTTPGFTIINLPGFLTKARGIDLFEEFGNKYAMIANQDNGNMVLLDFGKSYKNIPSPTLIDVPESINLYKVSMIKECNIWHAFVTDQAQDSLFKLSFTKGLKGRPVKSAINLVKCIGVQAIREGNRYYVFATKVQTNFQQLIKISYGNSLFNTPTIDSLGNFAATGMATTGLTNVIAFDIFRNAQSEHFFFGVGNSNNQLYRIKFQNACAASIPVATGDTIFNQSYSSDGKYFMSVTGFDESGNEYTGIDSVNVKNLVKAIFTVPGNRCKGENILFADQSTHGDFTTITSWKWDFGIENTDGDTSVNQNPTFPFATSGIYNVKLTVKEASGCENTEINQVTIADKPKPNFSFPTSLICTNDSVLFTDQSVTVNDPIAETNWEVKKDNQLVFTSLKKNPKFLFNETGTYQVSLKVKGESQCDSSVTKTVTVGAIGPLVSFTHGSACLNEPVPFSAFTSIIAPDSIAWYIDSSRITNLANFQNTFTTTNVYTVILVAYNGGCANSTTKAINVNIKPSFSISTQAPLSCQGLPVNFTTNLNTGDNVKFLWTFGDGTTDTLKNTVKTFADSGQYNVRLTVTTENGCFKKDSTSFHANPAPKAFFTFDKACKDEPVTFTNQSSANGISGGIISYLWDFGTQDHLISDQENPGPVNYNDQPGDKLVKLTVRTNSDCPNTYTKVISIGPKIAANYRTETGCIGTPFKFFDLTETGSDQIVTWSWNIGGLNYNIRNPIVEFDLKGTYDVRLKVVSQSGCIDEIVRTSDFTVLDSAKGDFRILDVTPQGDLFTVRVEQLTQPIDAYYYTWDFGDSTTSDAASPPPHLYTKPGNYIITLTAKRSSGISCSTQIQQVANAILEPKEGVKVKRVSAGQFARQLAVGIEVENESNIALRTLDLSLKVGNQVTLKETWKGILLPGATLAYNFKSSVLTDQSQRVVYVCGTASLENRSNEITPDNNSQCIALDTLPSLVSVFPNPAIGAVMVELNIPQNDPLEIKVINSLGQEVVNFEDAQPTVGVYRKPFDISTLSAGIYSVWFRSGSRIQSQRLIILRD